MLIYSTVWQILRYDWTDLLSIPVKGRLSVLKKGHFYDGFFTHLNILFKNALQNNLKLQFYFKFHVE